MSRIKEFFSKIKTKINTASVEKENSSSKVVKAYYAAFAMISALAMTTSIATAEGSGSGALGDIFEKVSASLKNIYEEIVTISSVVAITVIAICLLIRIFAKNPRSVEEATAWAKRAAIAWFLVNTLGYLLAYGKDLAFENGERKRVDW